MEKIARQAKSQGAYLFHKYGLILHTVGITLIMGIIQKNFFTLRNLLNILSSACLTSIAGIGVTCIMSSGEMDYGAGTHLTMGAVLMVVFLTKLHVNYFAAILMTLGCLALIGLLNAFLHIKGRMPAFIATMGTSFVFTGVAKMLTDGTDLLGVAEVTTPIFTFIGQGYLWGIIPMPLVVLVAVGALMVLFTEHTRSGKYLYAVGSNPEACKYIGINANVQKIKGFVLCSTLCGLAGIVQGSMINGALATLGSSMMLYAMIVLMLGAMVFKIGVFNIPGTVIGALLLAVINNGMIMMNVRVYTKDFVLGALMFVAVTSVVTIRKAARKG